MEMGIRGIGFAMCPRPLHAGGNCVEFAPVSLHVMNRIAGIFGRWTARAIGDPSGTPTSTPHLTNFDGVEAIWRRGVPGVVTDEDEIDADNG